MKKFLTALIFIGFAACGDEDGTNDPVNINNTSGNNTSVNNVNNAGTSNNQTGNNGTNNVNNENNVNNVNNANNGDLDMGMGVEDMNVSTPDMQSVDEDMAPDQSMSMPDMNTNPTTDPGQMGPLMVQTASETVTANQRSIPLTIYLPSGSGPYPVIVLSHGMSLSASQYSHVGNHLGSHGYVVVMPDYPGSPFNPVPHAELSEILLGVVDWIDGDIANGSVIGSKGDPALLGLAGHSLGGKISFLSAANDSRPDAVFGIDAVDSEPPFTLNPSGYPSVAPERMPDISVPIASLGETVDSGGGFMPCAPSDENFKQYYDAATSPALQIEIVGADHMDFLDDPNCSACTLCGPGSTDPDVTKAYLRTYITAFFDLTLKGMSERSTWLTGAEMASDEATNEVIADSKNGF